VRNPQHFRQSCFKHSFFLTPLSEGYSLPLLPSPCQRIFYSPDNQSPRGRFKTPMFGQ
jgi:hypothetical protein